MNTIDQTPALTLARRTQISLYSMMAVTVFRFIFYYWPAYTTSPSFGQLKMATLVYFIALSWIHTTLRTEKKQVVTSGPYKYIAHPAYTLYLAFEVVMLFTMTSYTILNIISSATLIFLFALCAYNEEKLLVANYKDQAGSYLARTLSVYSITTLLGLKR